MHARDNARRHTLPGSLESLAVLPPMAKIIAGAVVSCMALTPLVLQALSIFGVVLFVFGSAIGLPLLFGGFAARRTAKLEAEEFARGMAELPLLREAVKAAVAQRQNVGRLLRQRGYTSARVRRKLALECDVVLQAGKDD